MIGYEAIVRVEGAPSWGSQGTVGHRGIYLFADNVKPNFGAQVKERDNKLTGARESSGSTYSVDNLYPECEITWQPRPDDILPFMLAHFQIGTGFAGGTYEFVRIGRNINFTLNGSNWGTNAYSINVDVMYGNTGIGFGTGANGYRFLNGIVDKLTFSNKYGEDLKCTANVKFLTASRFTFPSGFVPPPSSLGSFSEFNILQDFDGTTVVTGETYDIDGIELGFNNNVGNRSKIGQRGWNRFPLAQHWMADGKIDMEFNRDLNKLAEGTSNSGTFEWMDAGNTNNRIQFTYHNFVFRPANPDITDGQSIVDISLGFRAYPTTTGGTSCIARVYTGSLFGTNLFNFFLLQ